MNKLFLNNSQVFMSSYKQIFWLAALSLVLAREVSGETLEAIPQGQSPLITVNVTSGGRGLLAPVEPGRALSVVTPEAATPVGYTRSFADGQRMLLEGGAAPGLSLSENWIRIAPQLWQRQVVVEAKADARYYLDLAWRCEIPGTFCSFERPESEDQRYAIGFAGPSFGNPSLATFPLLGVHHENRFLGIVADSPGMWENRCWLSFAPRQRTLAVQNGDGSPRRVVTIPIELDATTVYRAHLDGWQHIESGQRQTFITWIYSAPVLNHYDVQLSAHLALANAKGFNGSALEAILRNTSYLLLRRNLLRPESDYLFISGVGYGWKQWVTDGFWMSRGLDDPVYDQSAYAAAFFERINYEDNAQYYLIWSYLVRQAGGTLDPRTLSRAYHFMRNHERDGLYIPPRLVPEKKNMKTYHDQLEYEDDDAPASNQGFHCGALIAARELGFGVSEEDIERAIAGYARMFNDEGGYFATSLLQRDRVGQDSLYGEVLTYAVFGRKLLPDELVRRHLETSVRIQSPYGMRVISEADGNLLTGHSGAYVFGGSWFLNDAANYLCGLVHGMDPEWIDDRLLWRLEKELAWMPAFHESISTVTGRPHGHHLYSWNSGFWWLRREVRRRLGMSGDDPLQKRLDAKLGVVQAKDQLELQPGADDLQRGTPANLAP